jgi:hypothetical protein
MGRIVIEDVPVCRRMTNIETVKTHEAMRGIQALILDRAQKLLPAFTA